MNSINNINSKMKIHSLIVDFDDVCEVGLLHKRFVGHVHNMLTHENAHFKNNESWKEVDKWMTMIPTCMLYSSLINILNYLYSSYK